MTAPTAVGGAPAPTGDLDATWADDALLDLLLDDPDWVAREFSALVDGLRPEPPAPAAPVGDTPPHEKPTPAARADRRPYPTARPALQPGPRRERGPPLAAHRPNARPRGR